VNEKEELLHAKRFDGVVPLLLQEELDAAAAQTKSGGDLTMGLEAEGGRKLADVSGNLEPRDFVTAAAAASAARAGDAAAEEEVEAAFSITAVNSYTKSGNAVSSEYPWNYVVEPYRTTTLSIVDPVEGASYEWTVDGHVHGYGASVDALFMEVGYHVVKVQELFADAAAAQTVARRRRRLAAEHRRLGSTDDAAAAASEDDASEDDASEDDAAAATSNKVVVKLMAKYVRREVRALTDADREAWLSAVSVMQRVPTHVGQALYGSDYYSKDHFTRVHLYYGGALDCDHWHQGAGFVTSHVALTLMWEKALQAINPTIAAPYWDFTLDSTFYGASDWRASLLFSDDWFGAASPDNDLHTVVDGRFAFVPTMTASKDYSYWTNSYGVMRAPWNSDPTPFLTRASKVYGYENNIKPSGCSEYSRALKKTTWMSMSKQLNSAAHGHIHELMGGSWSHYYAEKLNGETSPAVFSFAHEIQALSKILWRDGFVSCPESCDMTTAAADCQCTCTAESLSGKTAAEVLSAAGVLGAADFFDQGFHELNKDSFLDADGNAQNPIPGYDAASSKHIYNSLLSLLCNPGHLGDMYQATSTNDITFWVIHNTVDRLWHFKRLGNLANYDETWDSYHTCYGHNPRNVQPFKDLFAQGSGSGAGNAAAAATTAPSRHRRLLTPGEFGAAAPASFTAPSGLQKELPNEYSEGTAEADKAAARAAAAAAAAANPADDADADPAVQADKTGKAPASLMTDKTADGTNFNSQSGSYYTNMELYEYLHPSNRFLQYVYDNFEWPHCDKLGYQMINTW